jgi:SAM-dependent methyltransferase
MQQLTEPTPAEMYQHFYGPAIFEPCAELLLRRATPRPGDRVLDVACGTGIVARRVAALVGPSGRVTGLDLSPEMIRVARSIPPSGGAPIVWVTDDATQPTLPDHAFDLVVCQQGLQFFHDRAGALRQMRRLLAPGGRVAIAAWSGIERHPLFASLAAAEAPHLGPLGIGYDELVAPYSLSREELAGLLADAGFAGVKVDEESIETSFQEPDRFVERMEYAYAAVVPQFVADRAAFDAFVRTVEAEAGEIVRRYTRGGRVTFPMHTSIATGRVG